MGKLNNTRFFALLVILFGFFLRLHEFLLNKTITWDETAVALSIIDKPFSGLTNLYYGQQHPLLFLYSVESVVLLFGTSEFAFRLVALFAGCVSIILFYLLVKKIVKAPIAQLIALSIFSTGVPLITYSALLREYTLDVLLQIAIYLTLFNYIVDGKIKIRSVFIAGICGAIFVWFSNPTFFLLATSGIIIELYFLVKKKWDSFIKFGFVCLAWLSSILLNYWFLIRGYSKDSVNFKDFLIEHDFPPAPYLSLNSFEWLIDHIHIFVFNFQFGHTLPVILIFIIGSVVLFKKHWRVFLLLISPLLIGFILSYFQWYPITGRHLLYSSPALIIIIAIGFEWLLLKSKGNKYKISAIIIVFILIISIQLSSLVDFQVRPEEQYKLKEMMTYVSKHKKKGDSIYLYNSTAAPYRYYSKQYGLDDLPYVEGAYRTQIYVVYLNDFKTLIGKERVWVMFTHNYIGKVNEEEFIIGYLDSIGKRLNTYPFDYSSLYLYDLRNEKTKE